MTDRDYTPYQRGVIRRFYQNRDALSMQKLQDLVGELYLLPNGKKADRAWERALTMLRSLGCPKARADYIERTRDLDDLSQAVSRLF